MTLACYVRYLDLRLPESPMPRRTTVLASVALGQRLAQYGPVSSAALGSRGSIACLCLDGWKNEGAMRFEAAVKGRLMGGSVQFESGLK